MIICLTSGIGKVVGQGPGRNPRPWNYPRAVVLKPILRSLGLELSAGRFCSNQSSEVWAWNNPPGGCAQTNPPKSGLGTVPRAVLLISWLTLCQTTILVKLAPDYLPQTLRPLTFIDFHRFHCFCILFLYVFYTLSYLPIPFHKKSMTLHRL